jgi:hypothetical protein
LKQTVHSNMFWNAPPYIVHQFIAVYLMQPASIAFSLPV